MSSTTTTIKRTSFNVGKSSMKKSTNKSSNQKAEKSSMIKRAFKKSLSIKKMMSFRTEKVDDRDMYSDSFRTEKVDDRDMYSDVFHKFDTDNNGVLCRAEIGGAISEVVGYTLDLNQVEVLIGEFDKDKNGVFDYSEFTSMTNYLKTAMERPAVTNSMVVGDLRGFEKAMSQLTLNMDYDNDEENDMDNDDDDDAQYQYNPRSQELVKVYGHVQHQSIIDRNDERNSSEMAALLDSAVNESKKNSVKILQDIAQRLYPVRDILCLKNANFDFDIEDNVDHNGKRSSFTSSSSMRNIDNQLDMDFQAAFFPSDMRCLALVSHNGMKKTMRQFVLANKNLLKKFRLTGTNSTMTMLKEVFKNEPIGTVVYGPACASGPLGGDAELVALMVAGRIGGILFFQDPMNSHPHRADIDCLVRQALVHNTMLAENPTSAYMLVQCLRCALVNNKAEMIPSFFFSLESPTVEAYKNQQSSVVNSHKHWLEQIDK